MKYFISENGNFPAQYFIRYSPFEKDGRIKYILDSWEIELLNEFEYQDVYNIEPVTPLSIKVNSLTYMIKINVKLVAGGNPYISIDGSSWHSDGIQLQYNSGNPRAHIGNSKERIVLMEII